MPTIDTSMSSTIGFPSKPPFEYNFTDDNMSASITMTGREVRVLEYNTNIEVVFQGTNILGAKNHPIHLHRPSLYVLGRGLGNYEEEKDVLTYNFVDPSYENTVGVPRSGWATIRFRDKIYPGVWFMHCHPDQHLSWGMNIVLIVKDGMSLDEKILPPPTNMPPY